MPEPSPDKTIGAAFIELQSVDSTNNYARLKIQEGMAHHGMVFFAHEQFGGKGQRGKTWAAEKGMNITLSIVLDPAPLSVLQQFQLNACLSVCMLEFFSRYGGDETKIKWPNDLYWQDRKAGGLLIESVLRSAATGPGTWDWAIAGIGININQTSFSDYLPNPVSLKQITGKTFDVQALSKELCGIIDEHYSSIVKGDFEKIFSQYNDHLYKKNKKVMLRKGLRVFEGTIRSVTENGKLVVEHGIENEFDFGEIEWVM